MPFYERQPYIIPLYQVLLELLRGEIRVPRFQRPGTEIVWTPEQRGDLLDSLYRGFPVGTILLWSTTKDIKCLEKVAGFFPQKKTVRTPLRLLLDGHQRLSTLLAILGPALLGELAAPHPKPDDVLNERWVFETRTCADDSPETSRDRFLILKGEEAPSDTQLPLEIVLDRVSMNRWLREHSNLSDDEIRRAESVRDKLREYNIPVAVLAADSLEEAAESFKRVNSSGTPMGTFHMVSALAYSSELDLGVAFDALKREHLEPLGWGELDDTDALRVCAGLAQDTSPTKLKVENLASRLRADGGLISSAYAAMARAAKALRHVGVHGPKALPYAWQFISLAILMGKRGAGLPSEEPDGFRRWFWVTTYGEVFAGSTATFDRAFKSLEAMLGGSPWTATEMHRDVTRHVEEVKRFDFRGVRSKAVALLLAREYDDDDVAGVGHRALAQRGAEALGTIRARGKRSRWEELVLTVNEDDLRSLRDFLKSRQPALSGNAPNLKRLGFVDGSQLADLDVAIEERRQHLLALEAQFVRSFDLDWR